MRKVEYKHIDAVWYFILGLLIIFIDQWTKRWAFLTGKSYFGHMCIEVMPTINVGLAFNLFSTSDWYVEIVSVCLVFALLFVYHYARFRYLRGHYVFAESVILGASISNVLDRFLYGGVADFLRLNLDKYLNMPVGNIADILIIIGLIYMLLQMNFYEK